MRIEAGSGGAKKGEKVGRATLEDLDCFPGYYIWDCFRGNGTVVNGGWHGSLGGCRGEYYCTWVSFICSELGSH